MANLDEFGLPIDDCDCDCGDTYNFNNCNLTLPESFGDALSYEQQILALEKYKQDKLTPGQNITIEEQDGKTIISATSELQANTYSIVKSTEELPENVEAIYNLVETTPNGESQNVGDTIEIPVIAGPEGFSPTVSVTETSTGHTVDITDKEGVHSFEVENGKDGKDGLDGSNGIAATIQIGNVETLPSDSNAYVTNSGNENAAILNFGIPVGTDGSDGTAATIQVGTVETLAAGSSAYVTNAGNENAAIFNFGIPAGGDGQNGSDGAAATIQVGTVETLAAGSNAYVTNAGNENAAVFNFGIPAGGDGQNGSNGAAATIQVGTVETLAAGSSAYVTNAGNENAAIFNFGIPAGETGPAGPSNVTQVLTSGTEIADINGTKIYAPAAGPSDIDVTDMTFSEVYSLYSAGNKSNLYRRYTISAGGFSTTTYLIMRLTAYDDLWGPVGFSFVGLESDSVYVGYLNSSGFTVRVYNNYEIDVSNMTTSEIDALASMWLNGKIRPYYLYSASSSSSEAGYTSDDVTRCYLVRRVKQNSQSYYNYTFIGLYDGASSKYITKKFANGVWS